MNLAIPRLRMFAGPNGLGKSTFKSMIRRELLGIYINPDDIEKEMKDFGFLDLTAYSVATDQPENDQGVWCSSSDRAIHRIGLSMSVFHQPFLNARH